MKTQKSVEAEKNKDNDRKALYKLMNNAIYGKTLENLRNRINVKLLNNEIFSHKIFDNNLVVIRKNKLALRINKPAYIGICIVLSKVLELSKVLMHELHYDYIKNKYDNKSKLSFTDTDSLMYEIKTEDVNEDFSSDKEMFDFSNYSTKSKCYDDSNKLINGKMKDETGGVANEEFVGLKPKMYLFLVDKNEYKKAKAVNKNVVATIGHNE